MCIARLCFYSAFFFFVEPWFHPVVKYCSNIICFTCRIVVNSIAVSLKYGYNNLARCVCLVSCHVKSRSLHVGGSDMVRVFAIFPGPVPHQNAQLPSSVSRQGLPVYSQFPAILAPNPNTQFMSFLHHTVWTNCRNYARILYELSLSARSMYVSLSKRKFEIGSIVSELNLELWKTGVLPQTL